MLELKMLIIFQAIMFAAFSDGLPMDKKIGGQTLQGPHSHHHMKTVHSVDPSQGHDAPPPRSYNSPCQFDIKKRCKGSTLVTTCDSVWNSQTLAHEHRCFYGDNATDVSHLMTCCVPCCQRPGAHDVYKWCADLMHEQVTCLPPDVVLTQNDVTATPDDCLSLYESGEGRDGLYETQHGAVYCDMSLLGGGWTLIQQRVDGSVSFERNWQEYKIGFGDVTGNYWMGLERIHELTSTPVELYVYLESFDGVSKHAKYASFSVGDSSSNYVLTVSGHSGSAPDSLAWQNDMEFSTTDNDNDYHGSNCAYMYGGGGGWWYKGCFQSNLNGRYYPEESRNTSATNGIIWKDFVWKKDSLEKVSMSIRWVN